jgi:hypothetical protein
LLADNIGNKYSDGSEEKLPLSGHLGNFEQIVHPPIQKKLGVDLGEKMVNTLKKSKRVNAN